MSEAIVIPGQTLADIAVQYLGALDMLPTLAALNGLGLTDDLTAGQVLALPAPSKTRPKARVEKSTAPAAPRMIRVQPGKSLADIAVVYCGTLDLLPMLAALNGLGLTDDLTAGDFLILPERSKETSKTSVDKTTIKQAPRRAIVQPNQTLADIAVQYGGTLLALPYLAALNNLSLTAPINAGQVLALPAVLDKRTADYFNVGGYYPAVGEVPEFGSGISFMGIEFDFIVR